MRVKPIPSFFLIICLFLLTLFPPSCSKKESDSSKETLQTPEPSKEEEQEASKSKESERSIPKKSEKRIVKKNTYPQGAQLPGAFYPARPAPRKIAGLDGLNNAFKMNHLNVWATEWNANGILLNGYVKSERERQEALTLARLYNRNITDMINVVIVYDNTR